MSNDNLVLADLYEDGYTCIPNYYYDYILPTLTTVENQVLQIILRKTLGYQKTKDQISITQLITSTKLAKSSVQKAIKSLQDKELIFVEKSDKSTSHISSTFKINLYKFVNSNKKTIPRNGIVFVNSNKKTIPRNGIVTVPPNGTTKERVKIKENTSSIEEVKKKTFFDDVQKLNETKDFLSSLSKDIVKLI